MRKKDPNIEPVILEGRTLARSWWGKAWNTNLESYADYSSRISGGRSYLRCGLKGNVKALVQGSGRKPYDAIVLTGHLCVSM